MVSTRTWIPHIKRSVNDLVFPHEQKVELISIIVNWKAGELEMYRIIVSSVVVHQCAWICVWAFVSCNYNQSRIKLTHN